MLIYLLNGCIFLHIPLHLSSASLSDINGSSHPRVLFQRNGFGMCLWLPRGWYQCCSLPLLWKYSVVVHLALLDDTSGVLFHICGNFQWLSPSPSWIKSMVLSSTLVKDISGVAFLPCGKFHCLFLSPSRKISVVFSSILLERSKGCSSLPRERFQWSSLPFFKKKFQWLFLSSSQIMSVVLLFVESFSGCSSRPHGRCQWCILPPLLKFSMVVPLNLMDNIRVVPFLTPWWNVPLVVPITLMEDFSDVSFQRRGKFQWLFVTPCGRYVLFPSFHLCGKV